MRIGAVLIAAAMLVGGCGGEGRGRKTAARLTPGLTIATAPKLSRRGPAGLRSSPPQAGTTQRVVSEGAALSVTLRAVIDPLRGSGAALQPGTRAVGVVVQIRNAGPAIYDSSATGDIALLASGGTVTPILARRGPCRTPTEDFDRYITAGEDRVGCVVFAIARGATVDAVRFNPHAQAAGRLVWSP